MGNGTKGDGLCDVCDLRPMIGVASTSVPFSCAYCSECAQRGADPSWVLSYMIDDVAGGDLSRLHPDAVKGLCTWHDGKFITIEEWFRVRPPPKPREDPPQEDDHGTIDDPPFP